MDGVQREAPYRPGPLPFDVPLFIAGFSSCFDWFGRLCRLPPFSCNGHFAPFIFSSLVGISFSLSVRPARGPRVEKFYRRISTVACLLTFLCRGRAIRGRFPGRLAPRRIICITGAVFDACLICFFFWERRELVAVVTAANPQAMLTLFLFLLSPLFVEILNFRL